MSYPLLAIVLLWLQAALVWSVAGAWMAPVAACLWAALRLFGPWPAGWRGAAIAGVVVAAVMGAAAWLDPAESVHQQQAAWAQPTTALWAEVLLLCQAALITTLPSCGRRYFAAMALVLATTLLGMNQWMSIEERGPLLLLATLLAVGGALLYRGTLPTPGPVKRHATPPVWKVLTPVVLASVALSCSVAVAWRTAVVGVQESLPGWIEVAAGRNVAARRYVRTGDLGSVVSEQRTNPQQVALRVYCERTPGYLRGRAFERFDGAGWHSGEGRRRRWDRLNDKIIVDALNSPPADLSLPSAPRNLFGLGEGADGPLLEMEIHNVEGRGEMFFLPLETAYVVGEGQSLAIDLHQVVHTGLNSEVPYVAYAAAEASAEKLAPGHRRLLLELPAGLDPAIHRLAGQVCGGAETTAARMEAVVAHFQTHFEYTLDRVEIPTGEDRLAYFLERRVAAHCEYFATATAVLLRSQRVPTRYVNGYVVTELEGEYGDYWLARNANAHAWVEAYDEAAGRWIALEPTPGMRIPSRDGQSAAGQTSEAVARGADSSRQRTVGGPLFGWLSRQWSAWGGWITLALVAAVGGRLAVGYLRHARESPDACVARQVRRLERRLRRRKWIRPRHETVLQFASRLRAESAEDEWLARCADWFAQYCEVRYSGGELTKLPPLPR